MFRISKKIGCVITASHGCQQKYLQEEKERRWRRIRREETQFQKDFIKHKTEVQPCLAIKAILPYPFWCTFCFSVSLSFCPLIFRRSILFFLLYIKLHSVSQSTASDFHPSLPNYCHTYVFSFLAYFYVYSIYSVYCKTLFPHHAILFALEVPLVCECIALYFSFFPCSSHCAVFTTP